MRQLEADWAKSHSSARGLQRSPAAYETATMLLDVSQQAWKVLYINAQASRVTGAPSAPNFAAAPKQDVMQPQPASLPWLSCRLPAAESASITSCKQSPGRKSAWRIS